MSVTSAFLRRVLPLAFLATAVTATADLAPNVSVPRFTHPSAGQTIYFVLTDRFANGRVDNDTGGYPGGPDQTGFDPTRISHYHGGDFAGLTGKLDYLQNLGVTAVWLTPPFKNKPMQEGTAGYHGYWILDFLQIDPHLGTNDEFRAFIAAAHARGMRVYMDIIANHTADVINFGANNPIYRDRTTWPYREVSGRPFDERRVAYNGLSDPAAFPPLSAQRSFPYVPIVPPAEARAKNPPWLNDVTLYHNRGNTTFAGESSPLGDFAGLDDLFTENPRVVQGFVEIFSHWVEHYGIDGFRIDTVKHVNAEFWQAFVPAIRAKARAIGRPDFLQFGEVSTDVGDPAFLSEFSTDIPLDTTLDFGFFRAAREFVSKEGEATALAEFFTKDDYYTDHDSNVHSTTTFLGNHDNGRFAYFLLKDNPHATDGELAALTKLGHGLLFLSRGQPVMYYGDEQGMVGRGGNDMQAREDMFASQAPDFRSATLLATRGTGADDKFDEKHPFYQFFRALAALRSQQVALRIGAMLPRATAEKNVAAFSRIERKEEVELVVALNNSRTREIATSVPTSQRAGAKLRCIFNSQLVGPDDHVSTVDERGRLQVTLAPLQFTVWRAAQPLTTNATHPTIVLAAPTTGATLRFSTHEVDGQVFPSRQELRADVAGGDGFGEMTFTLRRASRPGQSELLGVDDTPPYRIFWRPPPDLAAGEELIFAATFNDLRGQRATAEVQHVKVAASDIAFGIRGDTVPVLTSVPDPKLTLVPGQAQPLTVRADGTAPLEYQWLRDDEEISGATNSAVSITEAGHYAVLVRNRAGTTLSPATVVQVAATDAAGRIEKHAAFPSKFVAARQVDVWLPPGYDANPAERFPVIFMHDGQNLFDPATSFGGVPWAVDQAMLRLIRGGTTRGAIIVGLWNTGANRFPEYMPQHAVNGKEVTHYSGKSKVSAANLKSDSYLKFLVEEVKPFIDRTYRTRSDREHTFVMGSSMGGLISAYALVEYPSVFGGAGCISTHWPAGDGGVIDYLAKHLPLPGTHKLYFDCGTATLDAQYEPYQQRMDAVLRAAGYTEGRDWITRRFPGAEHSEKSWSQRVEIPLRFLLGG